MIRLLFCLSILLASTSLSAQDSTRYLTDPNVSGLKEQAEALQAKGSLDPLYGKVQGQMQENFREFTALHNGSDSMAIGVDSVFYAANGDITLLLSSGHFFPLSLRNMEPYALGWNPEQSFVEIPQQEGAVKLRLYAEDPKFTEMMQQRLGWYLSLVQARQGS